MTYTYNFQRSISVTKFLNPTEESADFLRQSMSTSYKLYIPGAGYRDREWSMYNARVHAFPGGVTDRVASFLRKSGHAVSIDDKREAPHAIDTSQLNALATPLRGFQAQAVQALLAKPNGICKASTGAGKSQLIPALVACVPDATWCVFVHRETLLKDLIKRFKAVAPWIDVGTVTASGFSPKRVTLATFSGVRSWAQKSHDQVASWLNALQGIVVDECHLVGGDNVSRIVASCMSAYWRYGVSATPFDRSDHKSSLVEGMLGPVLFEVDATELIEGGFVAKPKVQMVIFEQRPLGYQKWGAIYRHQIAENDHRNQLLGEIIKHAPKPCMVFTDRVEHIRDLAGRAKRSGFPMAVYDGSQSYQARDRITDDVTHGRVDVVVASSAAQEGLDIPNLASIIMAGAGKAVVPVLQRIGRGMRKMDGKASFEVYDIFDMTPGTPGALDKQARRRKATYEKAGHTVQVVKFDYKKDE